MNDYEKMEDRKIGAIRQHSEKYKFTHPKPFSKIEKGLRWWNFTTFEEFDLA
jgi:hypothetical protein